MNSVRTTLLSQLRTAQGWLRVAPSRAYVATRKKTAKQRQQENQLQMTECDLKAAFEARSLFRKYIRLSRSLLPDSRVFGGRLLWNAREVFKFRAWEAHAIKKQELDTAKREEVFAKWREDGEQVLDTLSELKDIDAAGLKFGWSHIPLRKTPLKCESDDK